MKKIKVGGGKELRRRRVPFITELFPRNGKESQRGFGKKSFHENGLKLISPINRERIVK